MPRLGSLQFSKREYQKVVLNRCMNCGLPKHLHTRNTTGDVVLKPEVRAGRENQYPPTCYPNRLVARRILDIPEKPMFGRKILGGIATRNLGRQVA